MEVSGDRVETYTHLRPRSLQFEQEGCLPAFDTGRSLRSHLTLYTMGRVREYGRTRKGGTEGWGTKGTIGGKETKARNDDKIGRNASEGKGGERGGRAGGALTSSFCKHHKRRTVRGSSLDGRPIFLHDGRWWKRRSPLRENRSCV